MSLFPLGMISQGGGAGGGGNALTLISTAYGTGSSDTITFSSIPSTYKHLQIRFASVMTSDSGAGILVRLNGVSTSSYSSHRLAGSGSTVGSFANSSISYMQVLSDYGGTGTVPASGVIDLLDYADTSKNKTMRALAGVWSASTGKEISLTSGAYYSTNAISSITLLSGSGNYATSARFSLYGVN